MSVRKRRQQAINRRRWVTDMRNRQSAEETHRIVAQAGMSGGVVRYTCACGETLQAHPDLRDEAFASHVGVLR